VEVRREKLSCTGWREFVGNIRCRVTTCLGLSLSWRHDMRRNESLSIHLNEERRSCCSPYIIGKKERADDGGKVNLGWAAGRLNTCARTAGRKVANHILVSKVQKGKGKGRNETYFVLHLHLDIFGTWTNAAVGQIACSGTKCKSRRAHGRVMDHQAATRRDKTQQDTQGTGPANLICPP
jgi:hypothetical protein